MVFVVVLTSADRRDSLRFAWMTGVKTSSDQAKYRCCLQDMTHG
jgi:hypothetical protein